MAAAKYDIYAEQGTTFKLHLQYSDASGNPISLAGFNGEMQVRDTETDPEVYLFLSNYGLTSGGTGSFDPTLGGGISGIGGISFNTNISGQGGSSGGILIRIDRFTMGTILAKKYFYDFKLINPSNEAIRLIEGVFEVNRQITR
jgi:hypothetical protein